jgi:superfamily II DNA or RNA helicase
MNCMSYLSKRGYVLKKEYFTQDELLELKKELRARPLTDDKYNKSDDTTFPIYIETKTKMYIPKMFGIKKFGYPESVLDNYTGKMWDNEIEFNGTLLERQIEPCDLLYNACIEKYGGILELQTGFGKTFCALYILSKLKCKAIIVVNKITLLNQWKTEIEKFLPNASIGILQGQKNVDIVDKDITIAMLQSLSRIDYPDELFKGISVTVIDEIHNVSSEHFSKILFKLCSKYTIGLSATPNRADGCEYVFKMHIGDIVYKSTVEREGKPPIIKCLKITSEDYKEVFSTNKFTGQKTIQFTSMLSELIEMSNRNKLIIELIKNCIKEKRKILVLSDRRSHLVKLKELIDNDTTVTFTSGLFLGSMKIEELNKSKACDLILATFAAFSEGVSVSELDTLILTTPKKYIGHLKNTTKNESGRLEQIVGRIFRRNHTERNPMIIDLQDNFSVYKNQSTGRKKFYKEHFKNGIFIDQNVNLDTFVSINSIITKKTTQLEEPSTNLITNFCLLDDE